ncbi:MAG: CRISPR-associated endoribonuclease Cas6 [Armatimonadetes bacterium]|nr:CRISPR-associated endoribonuclease Cas6 [Armatimonadota bacterium]
MLAALDLRLYPKQDCELPHPCAHLVHGAMLRLIRHDDEEMSHALHDSAQVKPFAISTMWPRTRARGEQMTIPKYTECRIRVCTAARPVFDAVSRPIFEILARSGSIELQGTPFHLMDARMEPPFGGAASFESLLVDKGTESVLRFMSPTTFRRQGLNVPLPDPGLVFGSLWQKWQAFSDAPVEQAVFDEMSAATALCRARIVTRGWKYPRFMLIGFAGTVLYQLVKPVSADARMLFGALSGLSFYTGVGYRTTMGMGQCRVLEEEPNQPADHE